MRGQDVVFGVLSAQGIEQSIYPKDAHKFPVESLQSVAITVHSAKNDRHGEGHRMFFRPHENSLTFGFDLPIDMFLYAQEARPRNDDAFLMYGGKHMLTSARMTEVLREIAHLFNFDPKRFSMHSLRIGGASALAASGAPTHYIQKMGRWKSLAFLQYIYWAVGGMADALNILSNPAHFTSDHLKQINPGVLLKR